MFVRVSHFFLLQTADYSLGRVNRTTFSDQTLMEMLIEGCSPDSLEQCMGKDKTYLDVCEWPIVQCDTDANVFEISGSRVQLSGTLSLKHIPPHVFALRLDNYGLEGSLSTPDLPESLVGFVISANKFAGSVDFTAMPPRITNFLISRNKFSGSCDFASLPHSFVRLDASENQFCGSISLASLPPKMERMNLQFNTFSGTLQLDNLPRTLREMNLSKNHFGGSFQLLNPPPMLSFVARDNVFCGTAVFQRDMAKSSVLLSQGRITDVFDENGNVHPGFSILKGYARRFIKVVSAKE